MYFLRGILPWQGLKLDKRDDRYRKIYEKKKNTTPEELCLGYPSEFCTYVSYARNLPFEQEPDYEYLRNLFRTVMNRYGWACDGEFDWKKTKKTITPNSRNVQNDNQLFDKNNKNVMITNISNQVVHNTETNYNGNILLTQNLNITNNNTSFNLKNIDPNSSNIFQTHDSGIYKPKNLLIKGSQNKANNENLNKSLVNNNNDRSITQTTVFNTQNNNKNVSILQTQNLTKTNTINNKSSNNVSGNNLGSQQFQNNNQKKGGKSNEIEGKKNNNNIKKDKCIII